MKPVRICHIQFQTKKKKNTKGSFLGKEKMILDGNTVMWEGILSNQKVKYVSNLNK